MGSKCATVEKNDDGSSQLVPCCSVQKKAEDSDKLVALKDGSQESIEGGSRKSSKNGASRRGEKTDQNSPAPSGSGRQRSPSPGAEDEKPAGQKKNPLLLKNALAKVRGALQSTVDDLKKFREFLRPLYSSPAEAFKDMSGGKEEVDKALFVKKLGELGFDGNAHRVFQALVDGDDILNLKSFKAGLKPQAKKANGIMEAIRVAKEAAASGGAAEAAGAQMAEELRNFREFVEPLFPSKKEAFNYFSRDTDEIDAPTFAGQLRMLHYTTGDPDALFALLADKSGKLNKDLFVERFETPLTSAPAEGGKDSRRSQRAFTDSQRRRSAPPTAPAAAVTKSRSVGAAARPRTSSKPTTGQSGGTSRARAGSEPRARTSAAESPARSPAADPAAAGARPPAAPKPGSSPAPSRSPPPSSRRNAG